MFTLHYASISGRQNFMYVTLLASYACPLFSTFGNTLNLCQFIINLHIVVFSCIEKNLAKGELFMVSCSSYSRSEWLLWTSLSYWKLCYWKISPFIQKASRGGGAARCSASRFLTKYKHLKLSILWQNSYWYIHIQSLLSWPTCIRSEVAHWLSTAMNFSSYPSPMYCTRLSVSTNFLEKVL